jgi:hypothetical protein
MTGLVLKTGEAAVRSAPRSQPQPDPQEGLPLTLEDMNKSLERGGAKALNLTLADGLSARFEPLLDRSSTRFSRMKPDDQPSFEYSRMTP